MHMFDKWDFNPKIEAYHTDVIGLGTDDERARREIDHYIKEHESGIRYDKKHPEGYASHDPLPVPEKLKRARLDLALKLSDLPGYVWQDMFGIGEYDTVDEAVAKIRAASGQ